MATADDVIVEFEARVGAYERDLKHAAATFDRTTKAQESRMAAFERRMGGGMKRIGASLGAIATVAAAREIIRLVDASKQLDAQLRLATAQTGNFAQAQEDVRRVALATRTGLEETAGLYGNFQRNSRELGITQQEVARATETVSKTFLISGANATESSQGIRQLVQALQSGVLRGDEFNTIMESSPRLARLLGESLNVPVGSLRAMAEAGELTSDKLTRAFTDKRFTAGIDAEFRELPVTFDQAMTQVTNAAIITFGAFDRGGGFSQMLANFVTDGASGFADLEQAAVETGIDIRSTFAGLQDAFQPLVDGARAAFGEIGGEAKTFAQQMHNLLGEIDSITGFLNTSVGIGSDQFGPKFTLSNSGTNFQQRFDAGQQQAAAERRGAIVDQWFKDTFGKYDMLGNRIGGAAPSGGRPAAGGSAATRARGRSGASADTLANRAEQDRKTAIRAEGDKQRDILSAQDDILAARQALAIAADDVARFELQSLSNEQATRLSQLNTEKRLGDLSQQEYDARAAAMAEEMDLRRQLVEVRRNELAADQAGEQLRKENDQLGIEADALSAQAAIAETLEKRRFLAMSALAIQQQIERSLLEQAILEGRIADAAAARASLADRQAAETTGAEQGLRGPLGQYADSMSDPRTRVEEAVARKLESVNQGISDALADALGTDDSFVKDMFSIFLDQVIFRPLADALNKASASGGGLGGFFTTLLSSVGSMFGPPHAIGGPVKAGVSYPVGENGPERFVPQQAGVIVPNHRLSPAGGGRGGGLTMYVDARGSVMNDQFARMILARSKKFAAEAGAGSFAAGQQATPGTLDKFGKLRG